MLQERRREWHHASLQERPHAWRREWNHAFSHARIEERARADVRTRSFFRLYLDRSARGLIRFMFPLDR